MSYTSHDINEAKAAAAFTKQATKFDAIYGNDAIIRYKRERVRQHMQQLLLPNSEILFLQIKLLIIALPWLPEYTNHGTA